MLKKRMPCLGRAGHSRNRERSRLPGEEPEWSVVEITTTDGKKLFDVALLHSVCSVVVDLFNS
jgi:hypothetical protein